MTNDLPPELLPRLLVDPRSMAALASVNKHYNRAVNPILYRNVSLSGSRALTCFSRTVVTGRPVLREYPISLHLQDIYSTDALPLELQSVIKELLMHVPNIANLSLTFEPGTIINLIRVPQFSFKLRRLELVPPIEWELFFDFLKTQPQIEHLTLWGEPNDQNFYTSPHWARPYCSLDPQILPNLKTVWSDRVGACLFVPYRPVTSITIFNSQKNFRFHRELANASAPLEYLSENVHVQDIPWERDIVEWCFPTLGFCHQSLREYSLYITFGSYYENNQSLLESLKLGSHPSYPEFAKIRECLSAFSRLRKFKLHVEWDRRHDLSPEFFSLIPELSQLELWNKSCPTLEEVDVFGFILKS
ncbi:hypothetical protein FRC12_000945 [Ceratobasidium sp. 428]|nr:hypothetical protein FRC12_000945 [Ceratobasidium sp. 428]